MFKGIRCECLLSLREVVIEWGIIGVCTDTPSKHLRESVLAGSSVFIGPHLFGKIKIWLPDLFSNWLINWPYTYICTGNTNIGTKRKSHISESIWTKCMKRTKACGFMYGINERAFTCARFTSHMYTDFNNIKIFTCMIFFLRSWLTDPYFETYVTRVSALAKRLNIQV